MTEPSGGGVGLTPQTDWSFHIAEIGFWIAEPYWGRRIAAEAVRLMTDEAFNERQFDKLFAPVYAPTKGSIGVLEKNGYELEGILKCEIAKNGEFDDVYRLPRLRDA